MSVSLTGNFLKNARGLTLGDGGGVTWSINKNTNVISATINGASTWPIASGFGTPTGNVIIANFPGASATLVQCSETIAEILVVLKQAGIIAA
jgi:hypothetical protein